MKEKEKKDMENLAYELKKYTYEDVLAIEDDKRYELIDGELYMMSSPVTLHQQIVGELYRQLATYLQGKKCKVFVSPLDVCLSGLRNPKKENNVVQPDIMVVCDNNKITEKCIEGVPDLLVEIISKSSRKHDSLRKFNLYQRYGVKEYWIVDPEGGLISQYILNSQKIYTLPKTYDITDNIKVNVLKDCTISLKTLMKEIKNT